MQQADRHVGLEREGVRVQLVGCERHFGAVAALDGFNLEIEPGELIALLGPSGCGKTTALRALAGLEQLDGGQILIAGNDVTKVPTNKRELGMVFQAYSLFPNMTATENVAFGLRLRKAQRNDRRHRAGELLELVGLSPQADRYPHQLSGGQQQRVALARALAIAPRVLLLDEPLSALDAKVRAQLRDEIRRIQLEVGITTLFVTHDQEEALSIADRVGVMNAGQLQQLAPPAEIYEQPANAFVAQFVGSVNRLPGSIVSERSVEVLGSRLALPPGQDCPPIGSEIDVLLRPESMRVGPDEQGLGVVIGRSFLGSVMRIVIAIPGGLQVAATVPAIEAAMLGAGTSVSVTPVGTPLFITDRERTQ